MRKKRRKKRRRRGRRWTRNKEKEGNKMRSGRKSTIRMGKGGWRRRGRGRLEDDEEVGRWNNNKTRKTTEIRRVM